MTSGAQRIMRHMRGRSRAGFALIHFVQGRSAMVDPVERLLNICSVSLAAPGLSDQRRSSPDLHAQRTSGRPRKVEAPVFFFCLIDHPGLSDECHSAKQLCWLQLRRI
jgi:hypothetical protein